MSASDEYRAKAADLRARAQKEPSLTASLENLALSYLRLAAQADKNAATDVVYETPPQQQQSEKTDEA